MQTLNPRVLRPSAHDRANLGLEIDRIGRVYRTQQTALHREFRPAGRAVGMRICLDQIMDSEHVICAIPQTLIRVKDAPAFLVKFVKGSEATQIFLVALPSLRVAVFVDVQTQLVFQDLQFPVSIVVGLEPCFDSLRRDAQLVRDVEEIVRLAHTLLKPRKSQQSHPDALQVPVDGGGWLGVLLGKGGEDRGGSECYR